MTVAAGDETATSPTAHATGRQRRFFSSLGLLNLAVTANYGALLAVLLPNQIEAIDPDNKVANLAIVTSVSFVFTMLAQPLIGALSDRTRSRLGRRTPWMIGGSVVAAGFLFGLGGLGSVAWICVFWVVIQVALNAVDLSLTTSVADRVVRRRRGVASSMLAVSGMTGAVGGTVLAGPLAGDRRSVAYAVLGLAVVGATALFVVLNRTPAQEAQRPERVRRRLWVDPRRHPDFAWTLAARFLFVLGFQLIFTYQLYILTDYVGLARDDANRLIGALTAAAAVTTVIGAVAGGWLSDRTGRRKVFLVVAASILAVALVVPLTSPSAGAVVVFAVLQGFGGGLFLSCGTALAMDVLPDPAGGAGKDLGLLGVAVNLPQAIAPALAALTISVFGGYRALIATALVCAMLSAVVVTRIRSVR